VTIRSSLPELGAALAVGLVYGGGLSLLISLGYYDCQKTPSPFGALAEFAVGILVGLVALPLVCLVLYRRAERRSGVKSPLHWFLDLLWLGMVGLAATGAVVGSLLVDRLTFLVMYVPC
jgi:hypothetical protein